MSNPNLTQPITIAKSLKVWFAIAVAVVMLLAPLASAARLAWNDDHYTQILAAPFITAGLIWFRRQEVFRDPQPAPRFGLAVVLLALACVLVFRPDGTSDASGPSPSLIGASIAFPLLGFGASLFFFGTQSFRRALFPLLVLLLCVPIPPGAISAIERFLQNGSADATDVIFRLIGTPVFRDGLRFSLPGVTIEVAPECSGIRSSIALFIASLVLGYLFLRTTGAQVILFIVTLPLLIVKNAIRISTLSWLGAYVSREFLTGNLHHRGGSLFFLLAIGILLPILLLLAKFENRSRRPSP